MTDEIITISDFLGMKPESFRYVLRGKRHLHFLKAQKLGKLLKCDLNVWQDPKRIVERQKIWADYCKEEKAA